MSYEKNNIAKIFAKLRDFNFDVFNFSDNRALRSSQKNFVDYLIISHKYLLFVEVKSKATKDKMRGEQVKLAERLSHLSTLNKSIHYRIIQTEKEALNLMEKLLQNQL